MDMTTDLLEGLIKDIKFDNYYNEATFQFKLLLRLAGIYDEAAILPERNVKKYNYDSVFVKKEIDILLEDKDGAPLIAIELKMPMNGQHPEQMFKFVEDIRFLEELKQQCNLQNGYLVTVTNDRCFWTGQAFDGIYSYFRGNTALTGKIFKPTGEDKNIDFHVLTGTYSVTWKTLDNNFRYFIIEV